MEMKHLEIESSPTAMLKKEKTISTSGNIHDFTKSFKMEKKSENQIENRMKQGRKKERKKKKDQ